MAQGSRDGARIETTCRVAPDHPAFAGHFPGRPVWPGVALLAEVYEAVRHSKGLASALGNAPQLQSVKFLAPVGPGAELTLFLQPQPQGCDFEIRCAAATVARGRLRASAAVP